MHTVADSWKATVRKLSRSLRDRRLMLDLSQAELAQKAGVSYRRVQQLEAESGVANPSLRVIVLLADALDTTVADLLSVDRGRPALKNRASKGKSTRL